jgi:hypothetical protein
MTTSQTSRWLATLGALIAGPSFVLNTLAHDGVMPGPDDVDRLDGAFSVMFMAGAALVVAALFTANPSPLGRRARRLLYVEAAMIAFGTIWAAMLMVNPEWIDNNRNPLVVVGDACWPLHQVFMVVVGLAGIRGGWCPSPARYALFGPAIGLTLLGIGVAIGTDYLAAAGLGSGWVIAAIGILAGVARTDETRELSSSVRPVAAT